MTQQFLAISLADIHGNKIQYEKIKSIVLKKQISFVFLCGDLLPKTGGTWMPENKMRTIQMQASFIKEYFLDYLTELGKLTSVYAIFGNDDFKSNYALMKSTDIPNVKFLDREVVSLPILDHDLYVAGYPYVGVTPFLHKDWEKWDTAPNDIAHKIYRTDGYSSADNRHFAVDLASAPSTIRDDLVQLANLSDPRKTIYIFHEAPYNTSLDMISQDNKYIKNNHLHIGSKAMREFIENEHPLITMHGHIHETFAESGDYVWQRENGFSITAANDFSSDTLSYVLFSVTDTSWSKRLLV